MLLFAKIATALVLLIHVYIVLIETVLFETRGKKVFRLQDEKSERIKVLFSNQGCYNGFLAAALALGLLYPDPAIARAFTLYGLGCVFVAGIWGGVTAQKRILFVQSLPAAIALIAYYFS